MKTLLLVNKKCPLHAVVFPDNIEKTVDHIAYEEDENYGICWEGGEKSEFQEAIQKYYEDGTIPTNENLLSHFEFHPINDEDICIPNKRESTLFILNKGKKNEENIVIEHDIAPYAFQLKLEDICMDYASCDEIYGRGHKQTSPNSLSYNMCDHAYEKSGFVHSDITLQNKEVITLDVCCFSLSF